MVNKLSEFTEFHQDFLIFQMQSERVDLLSIDLSTAEKKADLLKLSGL